MTTVQLIGCHEVHMVVLIHMKEPVDLTIENQWPD